MPPREASGLVSKLTFANPRGVRFVFSLAIAASWGFFGGGVIWAQDAPIDSASGVHVFAGLIGVGVGLGAFKVHSSAVDRYVGRRMAYAVGRYNDWIRQLPP